MTPIERKHQRIKRHRNVRYRALRQHGYTPIKAHAWRDWSDTCLIRAGILTREEITWRTLKL